MAAERRRKAKLFWNQFGKTSNEQGRRSRGVRWIVLLLIPLAGCVGPQLAEGCGIERGTPDFCDESSWINSSALGLEDLRGQVVLVDFWTYSCINCIRTMPHLTAWYETYHELGFTIVGVHTPEFDFEKNRENVAAATERFGINYPVVQDNDFRIWDNYDNRFWPAHYLIGPDGRSLTPGEPWHIGEGHYFETEAKIRELLEAQGKRLPPAIESEEAGASRAYKTPELCAGTGRQPQAIGNEEGYRPGEVVEYALPDLRARDRLYFDGAWHNGNEALRSHGDGDVVLRFTAGAANFVAESTQPQCIGVLLNGAPITPAEAGADVRFDGTPCILLDSARSYDFYAGGYGENELSLRVGDGFSLYTFAFSRDP